MHVYMCLCLSVCVSMYLQMQECKVHSAELHHLKKQKEKVDEVSDSILRYTELYRGILMYTEVVIVY